MSELQTWSVGSEVLHPRRPEWGKGRVQAAVGPQKYRILFESAGLKTLDVALVPLRAWNAELDHVARTGEKRKVRMKSARQRVYPTSFPREWEFEYISAWRKFWLDGGLPREWADAYPMLFLDQDLQNALDEQGGGKKGHFYAWLGAMLVWEQFHFPAQMAWALPSGQAAQRRAQILGSHALALESLLKKFPWLDFPQLLIFKEDFSKFSFVLIVEDSAKILPAKLQTVKELTQMGFEVDLIRVRPEKFQHINAGHTPA